MGTFAGSFVFPLGGSGTSGATLLGNITIAGSADFGTDFDCRGRLDPNFRLVSGPANLANALLRRLLTPGGFLFEAFLGSASYGLDLRGLQNVALTQGQVAALEAGIEDQMLQDQRVAAATVTVTLSLETSELVVDIAIEAADGPFDKVMSINDVTVETLTSS